ncbi:MAG: hypothetical protein QHJ73_18885, partial [Armatimonadota bacterium]|nr:hypothetical protein [Armatimonadota bacterium]
MMSGRVRFRWLLVLATAAAAALSFCAARGDPIPFSISTKEEWDAAIGVGAVAPVTDWTGALPMLYGVLGYEHVVPQLYTYGNYEGEDCLVMHWGQPDVNTASAWRYTFSNDPDLTGVKISFSIFPPPGITAVSVSFRDEDGNARGWLWSGLQPGTWQTVVIDPNIFGQQAGSTGFVDTGFDPTKATSIEFGEGGRYSPEFPLPPGWQGANPPIWNAWNHL